MSVPTSSPLYRFGAGQFWCVPNGGDEAVNPTPVRLATLQEVSMEFSADIKELYGENQYPEVVAVGKRKIAGKAKIGRWNTTSLNQMMFAGTQTAGMDIVTVNEADTVPAMSTYTITVSGSANYVEDLGVTYPNGDPLTKEASALTAAGQYMVDEATGIYTFDSADAGNAVKISYTQAASSQGTTLEIDNQLMGYGPVFQAIFRALFRGQECTIVLQACIAGKLSLQSKVDDFTVPEIDFSAFQDQNGKVGFIYSAK
ncbi:MAG: hypothetical protein ACRDQZ_18935 [Mycobacteriales bacterium]